MEIGRIYEMPERVATVSSIASVGSSVANIQSEDKYVHAAPTNSDSIEISDDAIAKYQIAQKTAEVENTESRNNTKNNQEKQNKAESEITESNKTANSAAKTAELSAEQKQVIAELKARDSEVRAHEQAHMSASAGLARGGASFSYQTGPDGQKYAIGGEVQIDISAESEPRQTITKMSQVRRAALAPADPSAQDRAIANQASQIASQARSEISSGIVSTTSGTTSIASNADETQNNSKQLSINSDQVSSDDSDSRIINAMGGTGSLTVLKSDNSDKSLIGNTLSKVYSQNTDKANTTLKTFA